MGPSSSKHMCPPHHREHNFLWGPLESPLGNRNVGIYRFLPHHLFKVIEARIIMLNM